MLKSTTKALGKSVKYVHGEIIERKMCGGIPWGELSRVIVQRGTI